LYDIRHYYQFDASNSQFQCEFDDCRLRSEPKQRSSHFVFYLFDWHGKLYLIMEETSEERAARLAAERRFADGIYNRKIDQMAQICKVHLLSE
jgi:hypothetical protein